MTVAAFKGLKCDYSKIGIILINRRFNIGRLQQSELIGGYLAERDTLTGIVVVMDSRRPFMPTDEWVIDFLNTRPVRLHLLLNKCDQLNNQQKKETLLKVKARAAEMGPHVTVQLFSGLKRIGVDELRETLERWIRREDTPVVP